jgi:hypothetical protein
VRACSCEARRWASAVRTAAAILFIVISACHQYRTVPAAALTPSAVVRVQYVSPREVTIRSDASAAARPQVLEFTGRVVGQRGDSLEVRVDRTIHADGQAVAIASGTVVAVPLDTVAIQARRFAFGRTAAAVLTGLGAVVFALFLSCGEFCR